jgi:cyanate permease
MSVLAVLLAHQGGWDEILLVLTPIALFAGLLWLANTRANKELKRRRAEAEADDPEDD